MAVGNFGSLHLPVGASCGANIVAVASLTERAQHLLIQLLADNVFDLSLGDSWLGVCARPQLFSQVQLEQRHRQDNFPLDFADGLLTGLLMTPAQRRLAAVGAFALINSTRPTLDRLDLVFVCSGTFCRAGRVRIAP